MRLRARRGFTLWEMAMVLLILAIAAGLAAPAAARLGADRPRTSADLMLDLLRDARASAIERDALVTLVIDPASGHFRVDTISARGRGLMVEDTLELGLTERLQTELPRLRYVFRPTGAAFADTVSVRGADGLVAIVVDPWSGRARAEPR